MFVTNWISTTKIQKISEITNFFRHYFLSRTEVVRNRNIYITLLDEGSDVVIYDYALGDRKFSGYVDADNGNRAYFELYRDSYSYNWRDYDWGYDWDYDDGWGYSKQHSGLENTQIVSRGAKDSVEYVKVADDNQKPVRRFVVK